MTLAMMPKHWQAVCIVLERDPLSNTHNDCPLVIYVWFIIIFILYLALFSPSSSSLSVSCSLSFHPPPSLPSSLPLPQCNLIAVIPIGFDPVSYSRDEGDGFVDLTFRKFSNPPSLTENITVVFSTADGTAEGLLLLNMHTHTLTCSTHAWYHHTVLNLIL